MRHFLTSSMVLATAALSACAMGDAPDSGRVDARADVRADAVTDTGVRVDSGVSVDTGVAPDVASQPDVVSMPDATPSCVDNDMDGYGVGAGCRGPDCNDMNPAVNGGATELCDGVDNDCDTMVDEMLGQSTCGMGRCQRTVDNCAMGRPQRCEPGAPMAETCNGMDDDCDGNIDNGVGAIGCYTGPAGTQGVGICRQGSQGCPGGMVGACMGEVLPGVETCNGADDDCDGMQDEGLSSVCYSGPAGTQGIGRCQAGMRTCSAGMMTGCMGEVVPGAESCNSADDDCNGVVDDGIAPIACYTGPAGTQGVGRCRGGNRVCSMGSMTSCTGEIVPSPEICGNGVDENCNGIVDDGCGVCAPGATRACYTGAAGTAGVGLCRSGTETCDATRNWSGVCAGQVVPAAESCGNMMDDNCNGMVDEGCACMPAVTNERCTTATSYTLGSMLSGNTTCAIDDHPATCGAGAASGDAAYSVAIDGTLRTYSFTMTGAAGFDTVLHMHSANACAVGDELVCTDDSGSTNVSTISVATLPQGTYFLVADGFSTSNRGAFTLTSSAGAEANNDTCAAPTAPFAITRNGTYRGVTTGKAANFTGSCGSGTDTAPDVVFSISVAAGRSVTVTTAGSSFDTVLYAGTTCGQSTSACNDDSVGLQSSITLPTPAVTTTYFVVVDGYSSSSGTWVLNVSGL